MAWFKRSVITTLVLSALATSSSLAQNVVLEGEGPRRQQLNSLQLKPFPKDGFDRLTDWTNGEAPTTGSIDGKVVVILCWSDWYAPAAKALNVAKRLSEKYAKDNLIVIAAHGEQGWKDAKKPKAAEGATLLLAHDSKGEFRRALLQDQDPDFYIIDRAGQMRFADVTTESVESGVEYLLAETKEKAAALNGELAAKAKADDADRRRSDAIRNSVSLVEMPEVPFTMPLPEDYSKEKVRWPFMPRPENAPPEDPKNPEPPTIITLPEAGFYPKKPSLAGRAILIYFWHPDLPGTYRLFEPMNNIQQQNPRDLVVVGVMSPLKLRGDNNKEYKLDAEPSSLKDKVTSIIEKQRLNHYMVIDTDGSVLKNLKNEQDGIILPWGAVVSSDNALRFGGYMGLPQFRGALDGVLRVDPGIKARRAAEDEYLRTKSPK